MEHDSHTGQLHIVAADPTPRVVVVAGWAAPGWTEVALVHSAPELATSHDLIVDPASTTVPWPVVVQTDLRFVVATGMLSGAIGSVTLQLKGRCGTQLAGTADRRWAFKAEEGAVVDRLQRPFLAAHPTIFGPAV